MNNTLNPALLKGLCTISKMALKPQATIRQMVREPAQAPQDSGWRFLTGDETQEYMDDPSHFVVREIAEIISLDPSIATHLDAPVFHVFTRDIREDGFTEHTSMKPLSQRIFVVLFMTAFMLVMLYTFISVVLYLPPYSWISDLQISILGGHLSFVSFLVTMVLMVFSFFAIAIPIHLVLARSASKRQTPWLIDTPPFPEAIFPDRNPLPGDTPTTRRMLKFNRFMPRLAIIAVGLGFVGYGLFEWWSVPDSVAPKVMRIDELQKRVAPSVSYVRLEATPLWAKEVQYSPGVGITDHYVPLSGATPLRSHPYSVVLKLSKYDLADAHKQDHFEGMLKRNAIPGEVEGIMKSQGIHSRNGYLLLEYGISPKDASVGALIGVGIGGVFVIVGLTMTFIQWLRERGSH